MATKTTTNDDEPNHADAPDADAWAGALDTLRDEYENNYPDRLSFGADFGRWARDATVEYDIPGVVTGEGVLQNILTPWDADDVTTFLRNRYGEAEGDSIRAALVDFASALDGQEADE